MFICVIPVMYFVFYFILFNKVLNKYAFAVLLDIWLGQTQALKTINLNLIIYTMTGKIIEIRAFFKKS